MNINGTNGNDVLVGHRHNDKINGLDGDDALHGGLGNDDLDGGNGNDFLNGGRGADDLTGGDGADTFYLVYYEGNGDHITDFQSGVDTIAVDEYGVQAYDIVDDGAGEWHVDFHTVVGDPRWDFTITGEGDLPVATDFTFFVV